MHTVIIKAIHLLLQFKLILKFTKVFKTMFVSFKTFNFFALFYKLKFITNNDKKFILTKKMFNAFSLMVIV